MRNVTSALGVKKFVLISLFLVIILGLSSCVNSEAPLNEAQQAEKYWMSVSEFKEQKDAAARMNMTIEDHLKMSDNSATGDKMDMDMWDDSSMIEDDSEEKMKMPEWAHKMPDGTVMLADWSTMSGAHIMEDWSAMEDDIMHMEMMHKWDDIEKHDAGKHGDH